MTKPQYNSDLSQSQDGVAPSASSRRYYPKRGVGPVYASQLGAPENPNPRRSKAFKLAAQSLHERRMIATARIFSGKVEAV